MNFIQELFLDNKFNESLPGLQNLPVELVQKIFEYVLPTRNQHFRKKMKKHIWKKSYGFSKFKRNTCENLGKFDYVNENKVEIHVVLAYKMSSIHFVKVCEKKKELVVSFSTTTYALKGMLYTKSNCKK